MNTIKSLEIIQEMMRQSQKSMVRNSFFFILWASLLVPSSIIEYMLIGTDFSWVVWPIMGVLGGIISAWYGKKESERVGVSTFGDRVTTYTWGGFSITLIFSILFSIKLETPPHSMILMFAALATYIHGGISNYKPFVMGAIALAIGAVLCAFIIPVHFHSLVFAASIFFGYLLPGFGLRKLENEQAK